jgi:hypothetical protein
MNGESAGLETLILRRLQDCPLGQTIAELTDFLESSLGDTREALYTLLEVQRVRFSGGRWHL